MSFRTTTFNEVDGCVSTAIREGEGGQVMEERECVYSGREVPVSSNLDIESEDGTV